MNFDLESAKIYYQEAFELLRDPSEIPDISVAYYPYVNTNHTIRVRHEKIFVRISDTFATAPADVHKALATILVAKLLRKRVPAAARRVYQNHVKSDAFSQVALDRKRKKGRKILTSPAGDHFDLEEIFEDLNEVYFEGRLKKPLLSWSQRPTFRRLGHHDPAHEAIVISKSLDSPRVPAFVVAYVLYHEMLHLKHPQVFRNGRRYVHTAEFRDDEEQFQYFEEAEAWIEENAARLKRSAFRKR